MITIDLQSRVPIYEQLYKKIVELIIKGVLQEDEQLPSVRTLAKELGVNPNTVAKSYQELERNKIIYSVSGRGSFISRVNETLIKNKILMDFDKCVSEALNSGISKDELKERIDEVNKS
ncbi:MAG: GntR family transcriptional regulator [Oscillospiraceae bacterium]|nr:GntR family transcriptional regulator [Oscillospiraceae bacterium]